MSYLLLSLKWRNDKILSKRLRAIVSENTGVSKTGSPDQQSLRVGLFIIPVTNINPQYFYSCGSVTGANV
jgi:hypothetical protein